MNSKTWKDLFDVPIITLKDGVKDFVEISFDYWARWLDENAQSKSAPATVEVEEAETNKSTEPAIADDLATVLDNNKAVAEKYQESSAESLLNYIATQLAAVRNCEKETVLDEIKMALYVPDDRRELLSMHKVDRAEFLAKQVIEENPKLVTSVFNGEKEAITKLDEKIIENAHGLVGEADIKFALRHTLRKKMVEEAAAKKDIEATDA